MDFREYQKYARTTAIYPNKGQNLSYPTLGLCGEAGEVAEKVKKLFRDKNGKIDEEFKTLLLKELGDVLWYLAAICSELEIEMDSVASLNVKKLQERADKGTLHGSGDQR